MQPTEEGTMNISKHRTPILVLAFAACGGGGGGSTGATSDA